jgi:transcription initiation factor TFIID subunit 12
MSVSPSSPALQQPMQSTSSAFRPQQRPQLPQPRPQQSAPVPLHQQNIISVQQQQLPQHQLSQQQQQKQQQQSQQQNTSQQNQHNIAHKNQLQISQQQAARAPVSTAPKPDTPAAPNVVIMRSVDTAITNTDAGENGNRLLTKRSIHELVTQVHCVRRDLGLLNWINEQEYIFIGKGLGLLPPQHRGPSFLTHMQPMGS